MKSTIVSAMRTKRRYVVKLLSVVIAVCFLMLSPICSLCASAAPVYQGTYNDFVDYFKDNNNYNLFKNEINAFQYRVYFWASWTSVKYGSENGALIGIGSSEPIKFLYQNGGIGIAIPSTAQSTCALITSDFYNGHFGSVNVSHRFQYQAYVEDENLGWGYFRSTATSGSYDYTFFHDSGIGSQKFFYGYPPGSDDANFQYSTGWIYVDGTGALLYDRFSDTEPHKEIVSVNGGGNIEYQDFYKYEYETDTDGNIVNFGSFDFDLGLSSLYDKWFRGGFIGQIREWIRDGQNGVGDLNFHILEFHTTSNGKWLHSVNSQGVDIDFDDTDGIAYKLARVTVPFLQADVIICVWLTVIQAAMGIKFIGRGEDE